MQRSFMLSVSALVMIYAGNAAADSSHLKGTFGFTGSDACLYASGGFNARLQALGTTFGTCLEAQQATCRQIPLYTTKQQARGRQR